MAIIKKVEQRFGGHVKLEFEDGSATLVTRGTEGLSTLKPGDSWPPTDPPALQEHDPNEAAEKILQAHSFTPDHAKQVVETHGAEAVLKSGEVEKLGPEPSAS